MNGAKLFLCLTGYMFVSSGAMASSLGDDGLSPLEMKAYSSHQQALLIAMRAGGIVPVEVEEGTALTASASHTSVIEDDAQEEEATKYVLPPLPAEGGTATPDESNFTAYTKNIMFRISISFVSGREGLAVRYMHHLLSLRAEPGESYLDFDIFKASVIEEFITNLTEAGVTFVNESNATKVFELIHPQS